MGFVVVTLGGTAGDRAGGERKSALVQVFAPAVATMRNV